MRAPFWLMTMASLGAQPSLRAQAADEEVLPEVVISARKRDEVLVEVPLAVSVLDDRALASGSVYGLREIAARVPGLSFEPGLLLPIPIMRGQWQPSIAGDNVGLFVDGVYQANRTAADVELLDFARVEVVEGPQSALFGHSAFAGAINYVSHVPGSQPEAGVVLEGGSDRWRMAQAWWSGPLAQDWNVRLAGSLRSADGTWTNSADDSQLGGFERSALALTLQRAADSGARWNASLRARFSAGQYSLPAIQVLEGADYNCGSQDRNSGLWSYFCGHAPIRTEFDLSPEAPDGSSRSAQVSLQQSWRIGSLRLQSDTSFYKGTADVVRDLDGSSTGQIMGVCTIGINCATPGGPPRQVNRLLNVNTIQHLQPASQEWTQELRLSSKPGSRFDWMLGASAFRTRDTTYQSLGVSGGDLFGGEQLTALLPATPTVVGPTSQFNRALVEDPASMQVDQAHTISLRETAALFGSATLTPGPRWRLGAELRLTQERLKIDSRIANFLPSFGTAIGARTFRDATPRLSLEFQPTATVRTYASVAKGSRSGGINSTPTLPAGEQTFDREYNWTWEAGLRWRTEGVVRGVQATAYYIDWHATQILGFSTSPQITNLITRNTAGIATHGAELAAQLQPASWLRLEGSASWVEPRFLRGSDDPGALAFCGVSNGNQTSTFCTLGAPRSEAAGTLALVPWIDGNFVGRTPRLTWHAALILEPGRLASGWRSAWRFDVDYQGDKFERAIEGMQFGRRLLLDARWTLQRDRWSLELWGRNLTDERYILTAAGVQPQFYPTLPRPQQLVLGEERRIGFTLRYSH
jgi:iron complex outermembrane receptor protein